MFFQHRAFWLAKDASRGDEYQDAYGADDFRGVAAVADGVSSSLFSGSWARILTEAVVREPPDVSDEEMLAPWLNAQREKWLAPIDVNTLPWHQKPKFQKGAHSTLLWVELYRDPRANAPGEYDFYAYAIGDCCLFHVRGEKLLRSFPMADSQSFDNHPEVLGSTTGKAETPRFLSVHTTCLTNDLLILCTDAIACWALDYVHSGQPMNWQAYWELPPADWQAHVGQLRDAQQIRYDDTTMLLLRIGAEKPKARLDGGDE